VAATVTMFVSCRRHLNSSPQSAPDLPVYGIFVSEKSLAHVQLGYLAKVEAVDRQRDRQRK
jgi:hypothetical protein